MEGRDVQGAEFQNVGVDIRKLPHMMWTCVRRIGTF